MFQLHLTKQYWNSCNRARKQRWKPELMEVWHSCDQSSLHWLCREFSRLWLSLWADLSKSQVGSLQNLTLCTLVNSRTLHAMQWQCKGKALHLSCALEMGGMSDYLSFTIKVRFLFCSSTGQILAILHTVQMRNDSDGIKNMIILAVDRRSTASRHYNY